jgi:hypothetical protein
MKYAVIFLFLVPSLAGGITGNFNSDCQVDFDDYAYLSNNWLLSTPDIINPNTDLNADGAVDINDLAIFADYWLHICDTGFCTANPDAATNPDPANHATAVSLTKILTWSAADCNGEETKNDVWFGETGSMTKMVSAGATHSYAPTLERTHAYQWRIDTVNNKGTTTGDVWDFNTVLQDAPIAWDGSAAIVCPITLIATDDGLPAPPARLKYVITELPVDVNAYLQDPTSGGQIRIDVNNLPYKLSSWGNTVWFATSTVGVATFKFKAYDGELYGVEKTVTVTVSANPKDCLSFDGSGYVTIPDNNMLDIEPNRAIGVCFATRQPFCTLFKKRAAGKGGYEVGLIGGFISARVYDNNGTVVAEQNSFYRYDNGQWANVVIGFNLPSQRLELYTCFGNPMVGNPNWFTDYEVYTDYTDDSAASFPLNLWPANNDCNLVVGTGYKYEIDAIRAYTLSMSLAIRSLCAVQVRSVAGDTESDVPTPIVRFKCNYDGTNNTTTQIYDDISAEHLIGTFDSNHVRYEPNSVPHWYDSAAFQQHYRN